VPSAYSVRAVKNAYIIVVGGIYDCLGIAGFCSAN
jgi:hypothetical protein